MMMWKRIKLTLLIIPLLTVMFVPLQSNTVIAASGHVVGSVSYLGNQFSIKDAILVDGKLSFTLVVKNAGNSDLDFVNYWVKITNNAGVSYTPKLLNEDKQVIPGKSEQEFQFHASVGANTKLSDLTFTMVKWDFSQPNFQLSIGKIGIPAAYTMATAVNQSRVVGINGEVITTKVPRISAVEGTEEISISIDYEVVNSGNKDMRFPNIHFAILTKDGIMYSLQAGDTSALTLKPRMKEVLRLTGELPLGTEIEQAQLLVSHSTGTEAELPVALYNLPESTVGMEYGLNSTYTYTNNGQNYNLRFEAVQNLPWEDQDIITAEFILSNPNNVSIPVLQLGAEIQLDGVKLSPEDIKLIKLDNVIAIAPGSSVKYVVFTKVPYTYQYNSAKITLSNHADAKKEVITDFSFNASEYTLVKVAQGGSYNIDAIGSRTELVVRNVRSYPATELSNQLYYVEVEAKNLETRLIDFAQMVGYMKTKDGIFFPAQISEVKNKLQPQAKVLLGLWAEIPSGYDLTEMELMIGQAVSDSGLAQQGAAPTAYIEAASLAIPDEKPVAEDSVSNLSIYPFEVSFSKIKTFVVNDSSFKMEFSYDLTQTASLNQIIEPHQLVIEIDDGVTRVEKKLNLGKQPSDTSSDTYLQLGEDQRKGVIFSDPNFFYLRQFGEYTLNIYDEFKGHKKLIGSKKLRWFVESD